MRHLINRLRAAYAQHGRHHVHRALSRLNRTAGMPPGRYEGLPAALELDDIVREMDLLGIPREVTDGDGDPWPLTPRQRLRFYRKALQAHAAVSLAPEAHA
jgi:hypothetical protein